MSDCRKGGRLTYLPPEEPTLKRLAELNGEPPWELAVPDFYADTIPEEATELVSVLVWRGVRYERAAARACSIVPIAPGCEMGLCSACGQVADVASNYCWKCGARAVRS